MKIGVRAHDYGRLEIDRMAKLLHEEGYDCAQIVLPKAFKEIGSYEDVDLDILERIRAAFEEWHLEIPVLGCYMDLGNPDREIREKAVTTFKKCLMYNKVLGAKVIGTETACLRLNQAEKKLWYPYMIDSIKRIMDEAVRLNMKVALEPVYCHPLEGLEAVLDVMDQIQDEGHLRLIFDASNLLEFPQETDQRVYWKKWLSVVGKYVEAMHIKDFKIDENGHYCSVMLGQGIIQYQVISEWIHKYNPGMYLIREEMNPLKAKEDVLFLRKM